MFFDATLVAFGTAPPNSLSVMASFDVPAAVVGVHLVTLKDVITTSTDTATFLVTLPLAELCAASGFPAGVTVIFEKTFGPTERKVKIRQTVLAGGGSVAVFCLSVIGSPTGFVKWNRVKVLTNADFRGASSVAAADALSANDLRVKINLARLSTVGLRILEVTT